MDSARDLLRAGQQLLRVSLDELEAPLPWDCVFDDDKVAIIDANGNDVGFVPVTSAAAKERAIALATTIAQAANVCGGT